MIKSFHDLEVWQKAQRLVLDVYSVSNPFPRTEQLGLVSQIRRAAYSIPSNIAEGYGRCTTKELLRFLIIANGSAEELRYFLVLCRDLRYLSAEDQDRLDKEITSVVQMMAALGRSLKNREMKSEASAKLLGAEHGSRATISSAGVKG